ncbi:hypothetical protein BU23DRAFT_630253, partial [Bimuria novae-zelandiae CBS 107.79]
EHEFADRKWAATVAGRKEDWKITIALKQNKDAVDHEVRNAEEPKDIFRRTSRDDLVKRMKRRPQVSPGILPSQNIHARFASLQTMMEMPDVGVFEYLPNGKLIHANDAWYRLSGHPRGLPAHVEFSFMDLAYPDYQGSIMAAWNSLIQGNLVTFEMRWRARGSNADPQWVLSACVPVLDENQNVVTIAGNTIDINGQKKLQEVQRRQIQEALEAKRQQENFIDMTSHELRNPLSAIVQCADSVISTLQQLTSKELVSIHSQIEKVNDEIATCIENLQTIVSCSLHQKRIIDDVLTLSKLDSNLLLITPMRVQPALVVSEAMKMFDVECSQMQINLRLTEHEILKGFEWVMIDPSRMLQVLINLLTNAIKFTKDRETRNITVTLGGSWTRTVIEEGAMTFAKDTQPQLDICDKPEWGSGKKGYIWLRVDDTGCGMSNHEQTKLFERFTQASPRTHIKYGGSGLGLFISKSLAALQGGSIGVKSIPNAGSTFVFYVSPRIAQSAGYAIIDRQPRSTTRRTESGEEEAMKAASLNIPVVEDNLVNQNVLRKQLQKLGCNASVAGNGVEALKCLKSSVYWHGEHTERVPNGPTLHPKRNLDIVLMDIEMPVMDGLTCVRKIRAWETQGLLTSSPSRPALRHQPPPNPTSPLISFPNSTLPEQPEAQQRAKRLPILAVSANARSEQVEQALAAGMDDAISKPFRIPELWPRMRGLVPRCANLSNYSINDAFRLLVQDSHTCFASCHPICTGVLAFGNALTVSCRCGYLI